MAQPLRNFLYTDGEHVQIFQFPTMEIGYEWKEAVKQLKVMMAEINNTRHAANHINRNDHNDYAPWLTSVNAFVDRWGSSFVPADIVISVHGAQTELGLPLSLF